LNGIKVLETNIGERTKSIQVEPGTYDLVVNTSIYKAVRKTHLLKGATLYIEANEFKLQVVNFSDTLPPFIAPKPSGVSEGGDHQSR
jgi:hypothetical protein